MAHVITDNRHYINIANAIRDNSLGYIEGPLPVQEFAQCIGEISKIGQEQGKTEGYTQGFEEGKESGIQSEYDRFWDDFQQNGERTYYVYGFAGGGWTVETFHPKYDIVVGQANYMFAQCAKMNLKQILAEAGITMTFQNCSNINDMFSSSGVTDIGVLDFSTITRLNCTQIFIYCTSLKSIDKIILHDGQSTFQNWFYNCPALENVTFEGIINANGLNVSWSPLTHDSLMSIITCLADKSADTSGTVWAVTIGAENLAKLTNAEKVIATQKGWTLA